MAYTNGNINIADMRDPTTTLYKQESRSSVVGWNPIVPYWLATATPSKIQIFDIRYTSANPMVSIQHSNVNELCWSPNNCDLLLAASKDRRINLWSLRNGYEDGSRLSMAMNRFELGSLCTAPNSSKNVFYGLDDVDSIISLKIDPDFLSSIAPTTNQDPEHREIEGALYSSDFTYFMEKITTLSREAVESGNYAKLKQLIQLTMPIKSDSLREFDENIISSIEMTSKAAFDQLLLQGTKQNYLNFKASLEDCASIAKEKEIQTFIDQMRLKIRVVELIASGDYCTLKNFINSLIESYIHDYNFLDNENSIKLVALIFLNDRGAGLQFVKAISSSFTVGTPEIVQIWHWIALYPTIFDASSFEVIKNRPSLSRSIGNMNEEFVSDSSVFLDKLRKHKYSALLLSPQLGPQNAHLVQQVHLNIGTSPKSLQNLFAIEEALNCSPQDSSTIENMQGKLLESCEMDLNTALLSAESIKAILEGSLKPTRPIEEFFQLAFRLQVLTENTPIVGAIRDFVTSVGMSRLKLQINQAKQVQTSPETTKKTIKAVLAIGTDPYCNLSEDQMNYLSAQLSDFQGFEDFPPLPMEGNHIGFNIQIQMIKNNKQK
jgi:WD40 repeat protein